jgi:hypothetical protein
MEVVVNISVTWGPLKGTKATLRTIGICRVRPVSGL